MPPLRDKSPRAPLSAQRLAKSVTCDHLSVNPDASQPLVLSHSSSVAHVPPLRGVLPCSHSSGCFRASSITSSPSSVAFACPSSPTTPTRSLDLVPPVSGALSCSPPRRRYRALSTTSSTPTTPILSLTDLAPPPYHDIAGLPQQGVLSSHRILARPATVSLPRIAEFGPKAALVPFPADVRRYSPLWPGGRLVRVIQSYLVSSTPMSLSLTHQFQAHLAQQLITDLSRAHDLVSDRCRTFSIPFPAFSSAKPVATSLSGHLSLDRARIQAFSSLARRGPLLSCSCPAISR